MTFVSPRSNRGLRHAGALSLWVLLAAMGARAEEPPAAPVARADRKWEGIVRRRDGLLLRGRWRPGTLTLREETLRFADGKDPGWSLLVPVSRIVSHRRVCRNPQADATCFEWSLRTKDGDRYVFRDGRRPGAINELFAALVEIAPAAAHETATGSP